MVAKLQCVDSWQVCAQLAGWSGREADLPGGGCSTSPLKPGHEIGTLYEAPEELQACRLQQDQLLSMNERHGSVTYWDESMVTSGEYARSRSRHNRTSCLSREIDPGPCSVVTRCGVCKDTP